MTPSDPRVSDTALDWVRRIHDPRFADWDAHIAWLEADPAHATAFDAASLTIAAASEGLAPAGPPPSRLSANDNPVAAAPVQRPRRRLVPFVGGAVAAGLVAIVALPSLHHRSPDSYAIRTASGERRIVTQADGTRIALNGDTVMMLDRGDPRTVALAHGEAFFTVVHDDAHPFTVRAGDAVFRDVGTAFDVVRSAARTDIAVRDGVVLYDPAGSAVRLERGRALRIADGAAAVRTIDAAAVGGWQTGRLSYADAPLGEVGADVARATGTAIAVDPAVAARRFTGVIMLDGDRATLARRIAAVTGVAVTRQGDGWRMTAPRR